MQVGLASSTKRETFINPFPLNNTMINKSIWVDIIKSFSEFQLPELIKREVEVPTEIPIKRAISIIGPRRSGKTYLMFQLIKNLLSNTERTRALYVNFEDERIMHANVSDLTNLLDTFYEIYPQFKKVKVWLFFDEIQNIENWEKFIRRILDNENAQIFVSGSSSKLLAKEIATSLRGRSLTFTLLPFSFREFLTYEKIKLEKYMSSFQISKIKNACRNYLEWGGYPEAVIYKENRNKILNEILEVTLYRDIIERYGIRNVKLLRLLLKSLLTSKEFSAHKFYNFLKSQGIKISKNSLYNYLEYLSDAFLIFPVRKFSFSYKETEQSIPKIYFVDNGLLKVSGAEDEGKLLENIVFIELLRRSSYYKKNQQIYYFKANNKEVDFVIKEGSKINQLIQVSYDVEDYNTKERELKSLIKASKELKCNSLVVVTWDYDAEEKLSGKAIKFIPFWKWILNV